MVRSRAIIIIISTAVIFSGMYKTMAARRRVQKLTVEESENLHCFLSNETTEISSANTGSGYHCLSPTWLNATILYILDSRLKNTWRLKIEKVMTELSTKTCLQFVPATGSVNEVNTSLVRILRGTSLYNIRPRGSSPPTISISSWESIPNELVDSLCIFHEHAHPRRVSGIGRGYGFNPRFDCLSRSSLVGEVKLGYINMLVAERINTLYNCGGCQSYRFFPDLLPGKTKYNFVPHLVGKDADGSDLAICRGYQKDQLVPGKLKIYSNGTRTCFLPYGSNEHPILMYFETLALLAGAQDFQWLPLDQPLIPPNAIQAGGTLKGDTLYIGKGYAVHEGKSITVFGKIHDHDPSFMFYGFDKTEFGITPYEVFVCKAAASRRRPEPKVESKFVFYYPSKASIAYSIQSRRNNNGMFTYCEGSSTGQFCTVNTAVRIYLGPIDSPTRSQIYHTINNGTYALGTSLTIKDKMSQLEAEELGTAVAKKTFHWYITQNKEKYFQFINRQTGMALDNNDKSEVYAHFVNGGTFQDWKIFAWMKS